MAKGGRCGAGWYGVLAFVLTVTDSNHAPSFPGLLQVRRGKGRRDRTKGRTYLPGTDHCCH